MSKCYPVVIYPSLILKFIVKNNTYNVKSSHSIPKLSQTTPLTSKSPSSIYIQVLFLLLGFLIPLSFRLLSPLWLITLVCLSISLGVICFISPNYPKPARVKNISYCQPTTVINKKRNEIELSQLLNGKVLQPTGQSDAPAGVSEQSFYQVINRIFPSVIQGVAFQNPEFSYPYSADFVLLHTSGLSIDIEIDEPYVGNTKAPHHCTDQVKDDTRNAFFTNGNWIVIRFSEKQAVKYPLRCCKVIASVLAQVAGDYIYIKKLENIPNLPTDAMWTTKQAKKWARANYRKTYLPNYRK
ncbi:MAG: hypothetical protein KME29_33480 [Calothrix sp. FI2-JRJ7]|nr:hypothetical protein [Calothrix sp. FI2-JRJ7]